MNLSSIVSFPWAKNWGFIFLIVIIVTSCNEKKAQQELKNAKLLEMALRQRSESPSNIPRQNEQIQTQEIVIKHVLKAGETLQDLAALYRTDRISILKANGIENWKDVKPGQIILIPIKRSQSE